MKRKNKFAIGFWITSTMSVVLAIALVGVIAAFTGRTASGFHITYTAGANVEATITAKYKKTTADDYSTTGFTEIERKDSTEKFIKFDTTNDLDENVEKEFETIDEIEIEKDDYILIHYTIKNDSVTNELTLNAETKPAEKDGVINNVKIEYALTNDASTTWSTTLTDVINNESIATNTTLDFYVRVSVDVKTKAAEFNGLFYFALDAVD